MVRVYGAQLSDVSDRHERDLGVASIYSETEPLADGAGNNVLMPTNPSGALISNAARLMAFNGLSWDRVRLECKHLITRTRSIYNRVPAGRVVWEDDLEGTLQWAQGGGTVTKASDAQYVNSKSYALKLVTGATAGNIAYATRYLAPLNEGGLFAGLQVFACLSAAAVSTPRSITVWWTVEDRSLNAYYSFGFRYLHYSGAAAQNKLQYLNSGGGWTDITGGGAKFMVTTPQFRYMAIMLDRVPATKWTYYYIWLDDRKFNLAGIDGVTGAFSAENNYVQVECVTDAAAATTAYFDDFTIVDSSQEAW